MKEEDVFVYDGLRVPTGKAGGYYKSTMPETLAAFLIDRLVERNVLGESGLEIILANSIGTMGNMARYASLLSVLPKQTMATTVDMQCGGAYQAIRMGMGQLMSGAARAVIAGGMESNSLRPKRFYSKNDSRYKGGMEVLVADFKPNASKSLADAAEDLAKEFEIGKEDMWRWAMESHKRAKKFRELSIYKNHVLAFNENWFDQTIRPRLSYEQLKRLSTSSLIDRTNTAHFHDGAAVQLLGTRELGEVMGRKPLARICDVCILGIEPDEAPKGAIYGAQELLKRNGLQIEDIDLFEVNESFAVKPLAFASHFNLKSKETLNVFGGNLAFGHPYSASGSINLLHLILALKEKKKKFGLLSAGVAGGFGVAMWIENCV